MTVKRTYSCNLCRDEHEPNELIGLEWDYIEGTLQVDLKEVNPINVENHICTPCLYSLSRIPSKESRGRPCPQSQTVDGTLTK